MSRGLNVGQLTDILTQYSPDRKVVFIDRSNDIEILYLIEHGSRVQPLEASSISPKELTIEITEFGY